jgi:hypothetical protein
MRTGIFAFWLLLVLPLAAEIDQNEVSRLRSDDLYTRLGLEPTASSDEIKKVYRSLVKRYHPDSQLCDPAHKDGELFKKVDEAYQVLIDAGERAYYDRFRKTQGAVGSVMKSGAAWQKGFSALDELQMMEALIKRFPHLREVLDAVIRERVEPRLHPKGFHIIGQIPVLWPSDLEAVKVFLKEGPPSLVRHVAHCLLSVPGWERYPEILDELISRDLPGLNEYLAEFFYYEPWINEQGLYFLHKLLDMGQTESVFRTLIFAGFMIPGTPTWNTVKHSQDVMIRILQQAEGKPLHGNLIHRLMIEFDTKHSPWRQALIKEKEARHLPYHAYETLKAAFANRVAIRPPSPLKSCAPRLTQGLPALPSTRTKKARPRRPPRKASHAARIPPTAHRTNS